MSERYVPGAWWRVTAAIGDGAAILLFAALGRAAHDEHGNAILHVLGVAAPFLVGWYVAAILLGAYRAPVFQRLGIGLCQTAGAWFVGGIIGLTIRSLLEGRIVPFAFVLIALGFVMILLLVWRGALVGALHFTDR